MQTVTRRPKSDSNKKSVDSPNGWGAEALRMRLTRRIGGGREDGTLTFGRLAREAASRILTVRCAKNLTLREKFVNKKFRTAKSRSEQEVLRCATDDGVSQNETPPIGRVTIGTHYPKKEETDAPIHFLTVAAKCEGLLKPASIAASVMLLPLNSKANAFSS